MKKTFLFLIFASLAFAQGATRNMVMTWAVPAGSPTVNYVLTRATGNATPQQLFSGTTTNFTDTGAIVGATYTYVLTTSLPPCAPITVTTTSPQTVPAVPAPCGGTPGSLSFTITVPAAGTGIVVINFTGQTQ